MTKSTPRRQRRPAEAFLLAILASATAWAQTTAPATSPTEDEDDDVVVLSPFEVSTEQSRGYSTASTLAGNRLNTDLKDLGTSLSIYNAQFLSDIGATDQRSVF
jgi:outer membrane receptor for ferric coprogen and ferric-rhodotorulic acid